MPSYKNFRNKTKRNAEGEDQFKLAKQSDSGSNISEKRRNNLIDWCTFYRRNIHLFVLHYLGIKLFPYQIIWIYWMNICDSFVAICSRADGKTWLLGLFACAKAILYPNSEIVVVSLTKEQAGKIVEKISSIRGNSSNLAREISNITTNINKLQVDFHNGSVIRIVPSRETARGGRSTFLIYEEFRLIDKEILDSVIRPFAYIRQAPYLTIDEYRGIQVLLEEPKEVFISSAYHKGLWWFEETKKIIKEMISGENSGFICSDFAVAIRHNIKTPKAIKREMSRVDEVTALEEYWNIPYGESGDAYFKLSMFNKARTIKKAFYPQRLETYNIKKNPYAIPKISGEVRLISCDVAQRVGRANDLSISTLKRLLPTHKGYFVEVVHIESYSGKDSISQSLRIKQLMYDFEADILVLDVAAGGGGLPMYDQLGQVTKDPERGIEYPAMTIIQHESIDPKEYDELSKRTLGMNARQCIYPISANAKLNSMMYVEMRNKLQKKMIGFLCDESNAEEYLIQSSYSKEFLDQEDINAHAWFLAGYIQTSLLINECIGLSATMLSGNLKLIEQSGSRKDRFSSLLYGLYYTSLLDKELLREEDNSDDFEWLTRLVQSTS
jgi:hypothetical protein